MPVTDDDGERVTPVVVGGEVEGDRVRNIEGLTESREGLGDGDSEGEGKEGDTLLESDDGVGVGKVGRVVGLYELRDGVGDGNWLGVKVSSAEGLGVRERDGCMEDGPPVGRLLVDKAPVVGDREGAIDGLVTGRAEDGGEVDGAKDADGAALGNEKAVGGEDGS